VLFVPSSLHIFSSTVRPVQLKERFCIEGLLYDVIDQQLVLCRPEVSVAGLKMNITASSASARRKPAASSDCRANSIMADPDNLVAMVAEVIATYSCLVFASTRYACETIVAFLRAGLASHFAANPATV
jgi:hypothetical protein